MQSDGGNPKIKVLIYDSNNNSSTQLNLADFGGELTNSYKVYNIPVSSISTKFIKGIAWQDVTGNNQPAIFLDQIEFVNSASTPAAPVSLASLNIYTDSLANSWVNWSWGASVGLSSAIGFQANNAWAGLYLHTDTAVNTSPYTHLSFSAKATQANQQYKVIVYDVNNQAIKGVPLGNYGTLSNTSFTTFSIPLADLLASNKQIKGLVIQESLGQPQPTLYIDNISLTNSPVGSAVNTTPTAPSFGGYTTSAGKIYKQGVQIKLKGVNWFGFETEIHVVHGLWSRGYKEMITQMKNLGFNAVRVPVCPATINGAEVSSIDYSKNADLQGLNSLQVLDKVLGELNNQGMYILLDHHRPDCLAISELWYTSSYSENQWIADLSNLAKRYASLQNFVGIDLKNEPHGVATWGTGNSSTDWNSAAEKSGKAVLAANPNILVFVEGIGESSHCSSYLGHFWGENLEVQKCTPISTSLIPANKLILSPHVYGPDVASQSYFSDPNFPRNMSVIWDTQFGFLSSGGFTLAPGEWGGKMGTAGGNAQDLALQQAWVSYMKSKGMCSSFYWSWNPNSGDTGGILQDDWTNIWQTKMSVLSDYFNTCN
ncbi:glycoside hydrolase family 5 protein [Candidatus Daviesbacteria bacterium]|nr:glycoside hydrolase family 5 protein [Candidatus Daviesbacteria bacterium]